MGRYNIFSDLKTPRNLAQYTLFRGTTDWSQLHMFDEFEQGFPYLVCVSVPKFLEKMAARDDEVKELLDSYKHVIEYEFKGLSSGIEDLSTDTGQIDNGHQQMNVILKTNGINGTTISMEYTEKSGSILTRLHEIYLRSVRDPSSKLKHYGGLIGYEGEANIDYTPQESGFDQECFSFLYMHTDNTGLVLERAIYFVGCMPTSAQLSIYQGTKGDIQFVNVACEFTAFPIHGAAVNQRALQILQHMNSNANDFQVQRNSWDFIYSAVSETERHGVEETTDPTDIYKEEIAPKKPVIDTSPNPKFTVVRGDTSTTRTT